MRLFRLVSDWARDAEGLWVLKTVQSFQLSGQQHEIKISHAEASSAFNLANKEPQEACRNCGKVYSVGQIWKNVLSDQLVAQLVGITESWVLEKSWFTEVIKRKAVIDKNKARSETEKQKKTTWAKGNQKVDQKVLADVKFCEVCFLLIQREIDIFTTSEEFN